MKLLSALLAGLIVVSLIWRCILFLKGADIPRVYYGSDTRLDGLLMGSLLAIGYHHKDVLKKLVLFKPMVVVVAMIGMGVLLSYDGYFGIVAQIVNPFWAGLGSCCIIGYLLLNKHSLLSKFFGFNVMVSVGKISYGLYIWHYPFFRIMREHFAWQITLFWAGLATFIMAGLSYYFIEKPFLRLKKY